MATISAGMDLARIAELLLPFTGAVEITPNRLKNISIYIDMLMRWNSRVNLTAVRDPEQIVTRHFGESIFCAQKLQEIAGPLHRCIDLGSGAGFPGIPMKLWSPSSRWTLIESNQKKAAFLREVIRALTLTDIDVLMGRAEGFPDRANLVTLRAVERFEKVLPVAANLLQAQGWMALLIGAGQASFAQRKLQSFSWSSPIQIPHSAARVLLAGTRKGTDLERQ